MDFRPLTLTFQKMEMTMWTIEVLCKVLSLFAVPALVIIGLISWRTHTKEKSKSVTGILALLCFAPIAVVLLFSGVRQIDIPRDEKEYMRFHSPDSPVILVVTTWERFPMNEWIDPALSMRFKLVDEKTNKVLSEARAHLLETSDLEDPVIEWKPNSVIITSFDNRRPGNNLILEISGK